MIAEDSVLNNRYRLTKRIGQGGFAQVYLALDQLLERQVAIKVLNSTLSEDPSFLERFAKEAKAVAALDHPNILSIFDYGQVEDTAFLIMPYVEGGTLYQRLRSKGAFTLAETNQYLQQVAAALDYAHRRNIVHRDIKPANMLLRTEDKRLLLSDFGIAKVLSASSAESATNAIGTVPYMSPEQLQGVVSTATDIYALGCVLFQMLTGQLPFTGSTGQVMLAHLNSPVPSIVERSEGNLPETLQPIIEKALAKEVSARYQSAGELAKDFEMVVLNENPSFSTLVSKISRDLLEEQTQIDSVYQSLDLKASSKSSANSVNMDSETAIRTADLPANSSNSVSSKSNSGLFGQKTGSVAEVLTSAPTSIGGESKKSASKRPLTLFAIAGILVVLVAMGAMIAIWPKTTVSQSNASSTPITSAGLVTVTFVNLLSGHTSAVTNVAWSPDGKVLASSSDDKTVNLWSTEGKLIRTITGHTDEVTDVSWSPDSTKLVSSSKDDTIQINDINGTLLNTCKGHTAEIKGVAWSPDGKMIATASYDKTAKIWSASDCQVLSTLTGFNDVVHDVAWSPDSSKLAVASYDKTI